MTLQKLCRDFSGVLSLPLTLHVACGSVCSHLLPQPASVNPKKHQIIQSNTNHPYNQTQITMYSEIPVASVRLYLSDFTEKFFSYLVLNHSLYLISSELGLQFPEFFLELCYVVLLQS